MSLEAQRPSSMISVHLPVAILSFAIALFLFAQIGVNSTQQAVLKDQLDNFEKEQARLVDLEKQLKDLQASPERQQAINMSAAIQNEFQKMLNDLIGLADNGDADSKELVQAFGIQRAQPQPDAAAGGTPAAAAPAATPAPAR